VTDKSVRPIMVVEDSDEDFEALSRAFSRLEVGIPLHRFTTADDCLEHLRNEAKRAAASNRPALILLDLNLPGTDGKDALLELKSDDDLKTIPVTVVTSSSNRIDVETCYRYGANGYMSKGGSFQTFQKAVGTMLDFWFKAVVLP
jgi:CheY-like chemotaxis protein